MCYKGQEMKICNTKYGFFPNNGCSLNIGALESTPHGVSYYHNIHWLVACRIINELTIGACQTKKIVKARKEITSKCD